jgi:protein-tyrosine kinase
MSRVDEALKRAGLSASLPRSASAPFGAPLDAFAVAVESANSVAAIPDARPADRRTGLEAVRKPAATVAAVDSPFAERLIVHETVGPMPTEQYRRLAAVLHHRQEESGIKVLMVASAQAGEGKTLTAANLALTFSESYRRRVLLIDADLRRPTLDTLFGTTNGKGLNEYLKASPATALPLIPLSDCLTLLPGGRPEDDPMAALTSARMRQVVEDAAGRYDWIILDTPPLMMLPDAHLLAAMAEAIVLVIAAGRTPLALVNRAIEMLGRDRLAGVVLNRVADTTIDGAGGYGYAARYGNGRGPGAWRRWLGRPRANGRSDTDASASLSGDLDLNLKRMGE